MVNPWPDCVCVCAYLIVRNTFVHTHTQIRKICEQKTWQESERMMMKKSIQLVEVNYGLWSVYTLQFQHAFYSTKFGKYANGQLRMRFGNDIDGRKNFEKPSTEKKRKKTSTRMQAEHSAIGGRLNHTRDFTLNNTLRRWYLIVASIWTLINCHSFKCSCKILC